MLLSLPNKLIILGTEVEVRGIPLCITFNFCTLHTTYAHLCLLLIKVNNIKKNKKEKRIKRKKKKRKEGKCHLVCSLENGSAYYISITIMFISLSLGTRKPAHLKT